jgi:erythronate-4-phosphate dehydrogenase
MIPTSRLLADKHIYLLSESIPDFIQLDTFDPDIGLPSNVGIYDALLVRTVTKVNSKTLQDTGNLKWVGTASAGYDHLDIDWLSDCGISVGFAPGCNARAVAEYVLTMAIHTAHVRQWRFAGKKMGVVGTGFVGSTVANLATRIGIDVVCYDPPRSLREPDFRSATLDEVLACDILTLHTPLIENGTWNTLGWLDTQKLFSRHRTLLIQASRGGVANEDAVLTALENGYLRDAIIDVWQLEPEVNRWLLDRAIVATPHIAGYSNRSKKLATQMAIEQLLTCLDGTHTTKPDDVARPKLEKWRSQTSFVDKLLDNELCEMPSTLTEVYFEHDRCLRNSMDLPTTQARIAEFRRLRTKLPYRDEYRDTSSEVYPSAKWPLLDLFRDF